MNIVDTAKEMFEEQSFDMYDVEILVEILTKSDDLYHNDEEPFLPDVQYDFLRQYTERLDPSNVYFTGVGSDVRGGKVKLPYAMGSLDQVQIGEITDWVGNWGLQDELVVMTDKLDGTSAMVIYNKTGDLQIAYSRGNGVEGADIYRHISKLRSVPKKVDSAMVVRGEVIIEQATFPFLCKEVQRKSGKPYKNPRNAVAGFMNSKTTNEIVYNYIKFVAYQVVGSERSKQDQLRELEKMGFEVPHSLAVRGKALTDRQLANHLNVRRQASVYEIDGLVLDVDSVTKRSEMNPTRDTLNPAYAIKYKVADAENVAYPTVIGVEYNLSKHGFWKPRVNIEPIELGGVTIEYATGFNAKFILNKGIGPGAVIQITRSGDVIPFIQRVVTPADPQMPSGVWEWTENEFGENVDAKVANPDDYDEVIIKRMTSFFTKIDAPMLKQATVQLLFEEGYSSISEIINASKSELVGVIGENGNKVFDGLREKLTGIPLYKIIGAHSSQRGIGVRKMKKLQKALGQDGLYKCNDASIIATVDGFDTKTAEYTMKVISKFVDFFADVRDLVTIAEEETTGSVLANEKICFTGIRDKELEAKIESLGGTIQSSVSGKTTILIAKNPDSTTGKPKKARALGIKIMGVDEFKEMLDK